MCTLYKVYLRGRFPGVLVQDRFKRSSLKEAVSSITSHSQVVNEGLKRRNDIQRGC